MTPQRLVETGGYTDNATVLPCRATVLLAIALLVSACAARGGVPRPFPGAALPPDASRPTVSGAEPVVSPGGTPRVVMTALALRGTRYRNGGSDPSGFDCSGFVQWTFNEHGVRMPREVRDQSRVGMAVELRDVQPGDLLFFETISRGPSHVGIAIGDGQFVHAPSSRGVVRVERYSVNYWARRFLQARRLVSTPAE